MEFEELKKATDLYVVGINQRFSVIEDNKMKLNNWKMLKKRVEQCVKLNDEEVLKQMVASFGEGCLTTLIRQVSGDFIERIENKIAAQSCDLQMIIKPR